MGGTKLDACEVPDSGASYNPSLEEHQELLWKAAMVEIDKEREQQKIERLTTGMLPSKEKAPTAESRMKKLSEGIVELGGENVEDEMEDEEIQKIVVGNKPKTRRQLRDRRKRMFEDQKKAREKDLKTREIEVSRLKILHNLSFNNLHNLQQNNELSVLQLQLLQHQLQQHLFLQQQQLLLQLLPLLD